MKRIRNKRHKSRDKKISKKRTSSLKLRKDQVEPNLLEEFNEQFQRRPIQNDFINEREQIRRLEEMMEEQETTIPFLRPLTFDDDEEQPILSVRSPPSPVRRPLVLDDSDDEGPIVSGRRFMFDLDD